MQVELVTVPSFGGRRRPDLGMHSLLNLLNVLNGQFYVIGILLEDQEDLLSDQIQEVEEFLGKLEEQPTPEGLVDAVPAFKQNLLRGIADLPAALNSDRFSPEVVECFATIDDCLLQLSERCCEVAHLLRGDGGRALSPALVQESGQFHYFHGVGQSRTITLDMGAAGESPEVARTVTRALPFLMEHSSDGCRWEVKTRQLAGLEQLTLHGSRFSFPKELRAPLSRGDGLAHFPSLGGFLWSLSGMLHGVGKLVKLSQDGPEFRLSWTRPVSP